jgi:hypothetical protein
MKARFSTWLRFATLFVCCLLTAQAKAAGGGGAGAAGGPGVSASGGGGASNTAEGPVMPLMQKVSTTNVVRGSPVTITGVGFGEDVKLISLTLDSFAIGNPIVAHDGSFTFVVPETVGDDKEHQRPLPLGPALLRVSIESPLHVQRMAADPYGVGLLHVRPDTADTVTLSALSPAVVTARNFDKLTLLGDGFPEGGRDLALLVDGVELPLHYVKGATVAKKGEVLAEISQHQLKLSSKAGEGNVTKLFGVGQHKLALRVGEASATEALELTITELDSSDIRTRALGLSALLLAAILGLAIAGGSYTVGRTRYVVRAFLLDTETESYSLGKLQFFLWTVAALVGYCYFLLSRYLVQGQFELPDIPEGLPAIIGISAVTTAGSIGITATRGPKGAGSAEPSFSDLVSVGGVVSPERFQFLLWTLVAVFAFLAAALQLDPLQIDTLPKIPERLLELSGISSAGYLGGKLVRNPGPVISEVLIRPGSLLLTIMGRNLERFARFEINGQSITKLLPTSNADESPYRAVVLEPEGGDRGSNFAKSLQLTLLKPDPVWLSASKQPPELELAVINQDGQRAAFKLELDADIWAQFAGKPGKAPDPNPTPDAPAGTPPSDNTSHDTLEGENK